MAHPESYNRRTGVNGSLAYEIGYVPGTAAPRLEPRPAEKPSAPPVQQERARKDSRRAVRPRQAKGISISTLVCLVAAAALVLSLLSSYVQMIELSEQSAALKSELAQLEKDHNTLKVKYESEIDLREIERYATEQLGMVVPSAESVIYVDLSEPDKAVVGDGTEPQLNAPMEVSLSAAGRILEYFR